MLLDEDQEAIDYVLSSTRQKLMMDVISCQNFLTKLQRSFYQGCSPELDLDGVKQAILGIDICCNNLKQNIKDFDDYLNSK